MLTKLTASHRSCLLSSMGVKNVVNKPSSSVIDHCQHIFIPQTDFFCGFQAALQKQCLELRSQVISLRSQVDTSQTVQMDFVQLSQSLQVRSKF